MKAVDFDYLCPAKVDEVCRLLAESGPDAKIIAGGQTLVPLMAMRLARPTRLIDVNRVAELQGIDASDRLVAIKACTRQSDALKDRTVRARLPLLAKALGFVGHAQTRNRGTIGGSLANADPAAEICLATLALDGEIVARRATGERTIPIADFFLGTMTTALAADECLTSVRFPLSPGRGRIGTGFQEVSARRSDFALVAVAVQLLIEDGVCRRASIALGGIGEVPVRALGAAEQLIGTRIEAPDLSRALARLDQEIEPQSDMHVSAAYRRRVVLELVERAVGEARAEASAGA